MTRTDEADRRLMRWALQSAARRLLGFDWRVSMCFRMVVPGLLPEIWHSAQVMKAHYKHLAVCGSVWCCPICSAKITEKRRVDLTQAVECNLFHPTMVTLTMHHTRRDHLADLLPDLLASYRRMTSGRWFKDFCSDYGVVGSVRALEVTQWINGWHCHLHVIDWTDKRLRGSKHNSFEDALKRRWIEVLEMNGQTADHEHGVVVTDHYGLADYVAKFGHESKENRWTVSHELTKAASKVGHSDHRTPFQILWDYLAGDKASGALFVEYARCFKGRHQLQWSRGMRNLLGLDEEKTDEVLAKETTEDAVLLAQLSLEQWRAVLGNDARGELLEVAHQGDVGAVLDFLRSLMPSLLDRQSKARGWAAHMDEAASWAEVRRQEDREAQRVPF